MKKLLENATRFFNPNSASTHAPGPAADGPNAADGINSCATVSRPPHDTRPLFRLDENALTSEARAHLVSLRREYGHAHGTANFEIELRHHIETMERLKALQAQIAQIDEERERICVQCNAELQPLEAQAQELFDRYNQTLRAIADRRIERDQAMQPYEARKVELMRGYAVPPESWPYLAKSAE